MQALTDVLCKPPPLLDGQIALNMLLPVVALPHFLYAYIWFMPKQWQGAFGTRAVKVFALCGALGKRRFLQPLDDVEAGMPDHQAAYCRVWREGNSTVACPVSMRATKHL